MATLTGRDGQPSKVVFNALATSQISVGTFYLRNDGTLTATATDPQIWFPRNDRGPLTLQGVIAGGGTAVTVEQSNDRVNVAQASTDLKSALPAGAEVDTPYPWFRVKFVQSTSSTTTAFVEVR
jgi:hypothetical protein